MTHAKAQAKVTSGPQEAQTTGQGKGAAAQTKAQGPADLALSDARHFISEVRKAPP
jgi:hypothetical protein